MCQHLESVNNCLGPVGASGMVSLLLGHQQPQYFPSVYALAAAISWCGIGGPTYSESGWGNIKTH